MKFNFGVYAVMLVFAVVIAVGLLGPGATGGVSAAASIPVTSGTVLSVLAATLAIGVLVVAGLQQK